LSIIIRATANAVAPVFFRIVFFFFTASSTTELYTLSLHDALPICLPGEIGELFDVRVLHDQGLRSADHVADPEHLDVLGQRRRRSEEHTSELQSRFDLVCRLLLEKKK